MMKDVGDIIYLIVCGFPPLDNDNVSICVVRYVREYRW